MAKIDTIEVEIKAKLVFNDGLKRTKFVCFIAWLLRVPYEVKLI